VVDTSLGCFYTVLAAHYDAIFPAGDRQLSFLGGLLGGAGCGPFLDVACGTGSYVLAVAQTHRRAVGIDLSTAMITRAHSRLKSLEVTHPRLRAEFAVGDMRRLAGLPDGEFAAAVCIGNSLPHLLNAEDVDACLSELARVLRPGGPLVIQTVNYDCLDLREPGCRHQLPEIRRQEPPLVFRREYRLRPDGLLDFAVRLRLDDEVRSDGPLEMSSTTQLKPWRRAELVSRLAAVGLTEAVAYGGFDLRPHDDQAPALVLVARRATRSSGPTCV